MPSEVCYIDPRIALHISISLRITYSLWSHAHTSRIVAIVIMGKRFDFADPFRVESDPLTIDKWLDKSSRC